MLRRTALAIAVLGATTGARATAVVDRGIFPDLDGRVALALPTRDEVREARLGLSARRNTWTWTG